MILLLKNQIKKIRSNLLYFLSISLILLIVSITFTAFKSSILRLEDNYDDYLESQNVNDYYMIMGNVDVNYLGGTNLLELCDAYDLDDACADIIFFPEDEAIKNNLNYLLNKKILENPVPYETIIDQYIVQFETRYDVDVEKSITLNVYEDEFIYKLRTVSYEIDKPFMVEGDMPANETEIALYPEFLKHNDLSIGDTYTIQGNEYTIVGSFYSPDFILPIFSSNRVKYDETKQSIVLTTKEAFDSYSVPLIKKYIVSGDLSEIFEEFNYDQLFSADYSKLGKEMQLLDIIVPRELNYRITSLGEEVKLASIFINVFLGVFTVLTSILLIIFMKKYINKNRRDIHILHSLGYSKKEISISLLTFPFMVSIMSLLGYLIGLLVSTKLFDLYSSRYYLPKSGFTFNISIFVFVVIIPIILILLVNYIFINRALTPKEKKPKIIQSKLFKFTSLRTQIVNGLLLLVISVLLIFGLNSNSLFDTFSDTTLQGNNYDTFVFLKTMTNEPLNDDYEPFTRTKTTITKINGKTPKSNIGTYLYAIRPTNELKLLINNSAENNLLLNDGVIISDYFSEASGLAIGDNIEFNIGNVVISKQVKGVSNELIESNMYMDLGTLNEAYNLDDTYYNGVFLTDDLYENDNIVSIINYEESLNDMVQIFNISATILSYITALSIGLALYVFILIVYSYLDDNMTNIATLKALGYSSKEIVIKYFLATLIIAILCYIVAIPLTQFGLDQLIHFLFDSIGYKFIIRIQAFMVIVGFFILMLLYSFTVFLSVRYFNKVDISVLLKKE